MTTNDTSGAITFKIVGGPTKDVLVDKLNSKSSVELTIASALMVGDEAISRKHDIVVNIDNNISQSNGIFVFEGTNSREHKFRAEYNPHPQHPSGSITFQ